MAFRRNPSQSPRSPRRVAGGAASHWTRFPPSTSRSAQALASTTLNETISRNQLASTTLNENTSRNQLASKSLNEDLSPCTFAFTHLSPSAMHSVALSSNHGGHLWDSPSPVLASPAQRRARKAAPPSDSRRPSPPAALRHHRRPRLARPLRPPGRSHARHGAAAQPWTGRLCGREIGSRTDRWQARARGGAARGAQVKATVALLPPCARRRRLHAIRSLHARAPGLFLEATRTIRRPHPIPERPLDRRTRRHIRARALRVCPGASDPRHCGRSSGSGSSGCPGGRQAPPEEGSNQKRYVTIRSTP